MEISFETTVSVKLMRETSTSCAAFYSASESCFRGVANVNEMLPVSLSKRPLARERGAETEQHLFMVFFIIVGCGFYVICVDEVNFSCFRF